MVGGQEPGSNSVLNDGDMRALTYSYVARYETALAAKKAADAEFKNLCKKAHAEDVSIDDIKGMILARTDAGAAKIRAEIERMARMARWAGMAIGDQADLFQPDRRTAEEKAHQEGFEVGAGGKTAMKVPEHYGASSPAGQAWARGWADGQESIFKIEKLKAPPLLRAGNRAVDEDTETEGRA